MRTNVVVDDRLMKSARRAGGFKTKKETIEAGLKLVVRLADQRKILALRGKLKWTGSLDEMRKGR